MYVYLITVTQINLDIFLTGLVYDDTKSRTKLNAVVTALIAVSALYVMTIAIFILPRLIIRRAEESQGPLSGEEVGSSYNVVENNMVVSLFLHVYINDIGTARNNFLSKK